LCPKYGIIIESFGDKNMGEAKRRKALDPNYGKNTVEKIVQDGLDIFPEDILVDYYGFMLDWKAKVPTEDEMQCVFMRMLDVYKWNVDKLIGYKNILNTESQPEFVRFLYYICTRGALIVTALEMSVKREITEEDVFPLWQPLLFATLYKNGRLLLT
jgi:hypothetical protein